MNDPELEAAHQLAEAINATMVFYTMTETADILHNLADCLHYQVEQAIELELLGATS